MTTTLRGMGWNHERCMAPLLSSSAEFSRQHPGIEFHWDSRPLSEFGDGHLEDLVQNYDLIVFDHPFVGQAEKEELFLDMNKLLERSELEQFRGDSLGPSFTSYETADGLWGLPIDAAAQVACFIPEQMEALGRPAPANIEEIFALVGIARKQQKSIALPLVAIDAICLYFTLTAGFGDPIPRDGASFPSDETSKRALDVMLRFRDSVDPRSLEWNPIQCFDYMSEHDDIVYQPFAFGYTNYARKNCSGKHRLAFTDIPSINGFDCAGSILGGAGIGITSASQHVDEALAYSKWVCSPSYQASNYTASGGQPASLAAWQAQGPNDLTCTFFRNTIATHQNAYLRPTFYGIIPWFRASGNLLVEFLKDEVSEQECMTRLKDSFLLARG